MLFIELLKLFTSFICFLVFVENQYFNSLVVWMGIIFHFFDPIKWYEVKQI